MRMGVLSQPVAAMLAQGLPLEQAFIPVRNYARNVFTVLFMGVGTIVGAVLTHDFHIIGKLEIAVAAQYLLMVHREMSVCLVFIGHVEIPVYIYCIGEIYASVLKIISSCKKTAIVYVQ